MIPSLYCIRISWLTRGGGSSRESTPTTSADEVGVAHVVVGDGEQVAGLVELLLHHAGLGAVEALAELGGLARLATFGCIGLTYNSHPKMGNSLWSSHGAGDLLGDVQGWPP
jgi:hypothetical protein